MPHDPTICPTAAQLFELYPVFDKPPYASGFQVWTMDVIGSGSGLYLTNILSVAYPYQSDGTEPDATALRDAILAVLTAAPVPQWLAASDGATALKVSSTEDGLSLTATSNLGPTGSELILVESTTLTASVILDQALEFAGCLVCDWGCSTFDGCLAAAVHWLKMWGQGQSTGGGPSGQIASMVQGPFSVSFATSQTTSGADGWWGGSPEGMQFLFLRKQQGPRPISLRSGRACFPVGPFGGRRSSVRRFF